MMIPPVQIFFGVVQTLMNCLHVLIIAHDELQAELRDINIPPIPNIFQILNILFLNVQFLFDLYERDRKFNKAHLLITLLRGYR